MRGTQTIERTGKFWKAQRLVSGALLLGVIIYAACAGEDGLPWAIPIFLGAALWWLAARFGAWWCHG